MTARIEAQKQTRPRATSAAVDPVAEFAERARAHVQVPLERVRALLADVRAGELGPGEVGTLVESTQELVDRIDDLDASLEGVNVGPGPRLTLALASELSFIARHLESPLPAPTVERLQPRVRRAARLATMWLSPYEYGATSTHGPSSAASADWKSTDVAEQSPAAAGSIVDRDAESVQPTAAEPSVNAPAAPAADADPSLAAVDDAAQRVVFDRLEQLRTDRAALEERLEIVDRYWRFATHELRNASQSMVMLLERVDSGLSEAPWFEPLARATRTLLHRSQEALDDRAIAGGLFSVVLEPCDLVEVTIGALDEARALADARGVRLVGERLPVGQPLWAVADPGRVQQILLNLLRNAIEATPQGGFVMAEAAAIDGYACVMVRDSGAGLDPQRAYQLLHLGERRSGAGARAGLGLPICRHLAEAMDGWMEPCEPLPGVGAGFKLGLPRYLP